MDNANPGIVIEQVATFPDNGREIKQGYYYRLGGLSLEQRYLAAPIARCEVAQYFPIKLRGASGTLHSKHRVRRFLLESARSSDELFSIFVN